jgi:hypothetical protein|tara:strand:+ start:579 stop:962 length:384 start_codon:yes stop_codon:yes gene_type:complete
MSTAPLDRTEPSAAAEAKSKHVGNLSSTYLLAGAGLSDEQKLQVALCRRQCWIRAAQCSVVATVTSYAALLLARSTRALKPPHGSLLYVPLSLGVLGGYLGSVWGGHEGAAMMAATLGLDGMRRFQR